MIRISWLNRARKFGGQHIFYPFSNPMLETPQCITKVEFIKEDGVELVGVELRQGRNHWDESDDIVFV